MSNYLCTKCGETAFSKCAASRNIFPSNEIATMYGNMVTMDVNRKGAKDERYRRSAHDSNLWEATFTYTMLVHADDEEEAYRQANFARRISLPEELAKIVACNHRWTLTAPKCEMGCCTRKEEDGL